jgi:glycine oxidase
LDYLSRLGLDLEWLSGYEARKREPHLARTVTGAIFSPLDHQVDNRRVAPALRAAFLAAGGTLLEDAEVRELLHDGARVTGVRLADRIIAAETVVLAAGAWSRNLPGLPAEARPPVRPVKGQMLAVAMDTSAPLLRHVVWGRKGLYLVPRDDGRLVVGATVEEMGFDTAMTAGGVFELLRNAWETVPGIYDLPLVETWAGLRPASRDDAPILGPTPLDGLMLATGHHRNGILLAPLTARVVADCVLTGRLAESARPFTLARFARPADNGRAGRAAIGAAAEGR